MAGKTRLRATQVTENTIEDKDGDTKVAVEESSDEDKIRFDTAGTQRMIIDETGQVGVGTDAPEEQFHIHGSNATLRLGNGVNSGEHSPKIQLSEMADSNGDMAYGFSVGYNGSTNNFELKRYSGNTAGSDVLIASRNSGDIGIKTTSPEADLHIYGGNSGETFSNVTFAAENAGSSDSFYVFQTATAGGGKSFSITNGGKVGIGTTAPSSILTLNGTQPSLTFRESDSDRAEILVNDSDNLVITNQSTNKYIVFKTDDAGTIREGLRIGGVTPEVVVNEGSDSLVDFRVESDNNTHMLFVDGGNDRIGIGTSSPSVMLDMVGESAGETQIRLEQNNTDADAPDMRFFKSRGTTASKTAVADNDNLAFVNSFAYDGANYQQAGAFGWNADGTDGDSTFSLKTRVAGTTADRLTVDAVGNLAVPGDLFVSGTMRTTNDISFQDNGGTFPTNTAGFFWDLNNDEARIYAKQPSSDAIDFVFKLSDNNHSQDRYIFWIDDYRGSSYDRYPLSLRGDGVFFNMVHSSEGVPNFTTAKARIDSEGRLALRTSSDPSTLNDNAHIYSKNISGHAEMFVRDSQGNVTQISPHNDEGEWEYFSKNTTTGKVVRINMEKMIRRLESITGESFMQEWYEDV